MDERHSSVRLYEMPSRRLLALLLKIDVADTTLSGLADDQLGPIVSRSLTVSFGGLTGDDGLSVLRRALDECAQPGLQDREAAIPVLCRTIYDLYCAGAGVPAVNFEVFEAVFSRFLVLLRDGLTQAAGPQLIDTPGRTFGALNLEELSRLQAPEELSRYMASLVACFRKRQVLSTVDADYLISLLEKTVSSPGYLRFLGEDKKRQEIARLLHLAMIIQSSDGPSDPAANDLIITIGLLLYNISPSEKAAAGLAAARPSTVCPALLYHYNAVLAMNYVLTGQLGLASGHATLASGCTEDRGMTAYMWVLQGCIALRQGDHRRALDLLKRAGACAPDGRIKALACFCRGVIFSEKKEYANAIGCFREAAGHVTDPLDSATVHDNIGCCACELGDLTRAELSFTELEKLADHLDGDDALRCRLAASSHFARISRARGEFPRAVEYYRQALEIALRSGDRQAVANQLGYLGTACACTGDADTALQFLNACMTNSEHLSYWPGIRFAYWHIDRMLVEKGDRAGTQTFLETYASRYPELRNLR